MQVTKHASEGIHRDFETQGRRHQKSKTGVSVSGPTKRTYVLQKLKKNTHKEINKKLTAFASVVAVLLAHGVEERGVYARDTVHRHPVRRVDLQLPHRYRHRVLHVRVPVRGKDGSTRGVVLC